MHLYYRIIGNIKDSWWHFRQRCQRFKRGYAYADVWDMDQWFMRTVRLMLIHLRDHGNSFPMEFNTRDEWWSVLNEMINCLNFMDEDIARSFLGFGEIGDWKRMTEEDHKHVYKIMAENKIRFFELFSKYFYNLWD